MTPCDQCPCEDHLSDASCDCPCHWEWSKGDDFEVDIELLSAEDPLESDDA